MSICIIENPATNTKPRVDKTFSFEAGPAACLNSERISGIVRYMLIHMKHFKSFQLINWHVTETLVAQYRASVFATFNIWSNVPVYLAPWTGCPPGGKPTMDRLPPGGQPVPGYPTPHPGHLHPRGATYPGWFILPPGGEDKPAGYLAPHP